MTTLTDINGWSVPEDSDPPNIRQLKTLADQIDIKLMPTMTSTNRDTVYEDPEEGALAYISDRTSVEKFTDRWRTADWSRTFMSQSQIQAEDTTLLVLPDMSFSVTAGASYVFDGIIAHRGHTNNDIKYTWTGPGGTRANWCVPLITSPTAAVTAMSGTTNIPCTTGTTHIFRFRGYVYVATTSGTYQLYFAKQTNSDTSTPTIVFGQGATNLRVAYLGGE